MVKPTIIVIGYNRPKSLNRLLTSLNEMEVEEKDINLYISLDKAKNDDVGNNECVNVANDFEWKLGNKIVDIKSSNYGLKNHVLYCGDLTEKFENVIVLEDDIVVSKYMYKYACSLLEFYKDDANIAGFSLYSFPRNFNNLKKFNPLNNGTDCYFMKIACSWGQMWTKKQWNDFYKWYLQNEKIDFNKEDTLEVIKGWGNKSWLKYYMLYLVKNNKYYTFPYESFTTNFSDVGVHCESVNNNYQANMIYDKKNDFYFEKFNKSSVIYDNYFENEKLNDILKYDEKIDGDFYGQKKNITTKYLLSSQILDYKIISSYSLEMYPYEMNIIYDIKGNDLFLYDTSTIEKNKNKRNNLIDYIYGIRFISVKEKIKIINEFLSDILKKIIKR